MNDLVSRLSICFGLAGLLCAGLLPAARAADSAPAAGERIAAAMAWADTLPIDTRAIREIDRFAAAEKGVFRGVYAAEFAAAARRRVFSAVSDALSNPAVLGGEPSVEVAFMEPGFGGGLQGAGVPPLEAEFEKSIIRTECLAFFEGKDMSPDAALEIYTGPAFRIGVQSRIKRIWMEDGLDCVETEGMKFLLSPTLYCSRLDEYRDSTVVMQHSQVVANGDEYETVYFKESLKTFVKVPGGMIFHYINFFRGSSLGGVRKSVGKGKIIESETRAIEELSRRLSERTMPGN
jgi:hypothetical protein